jgi:alpha-tubulin suppressor-like RCC1 family protein
LDGLAVANGLATQGWFEWGTNAAFTERTTPADLGDSGSVIRVQAALTNLLPSYGYDFRLVVSNSSGVVYGARQRFTLEANLKLAWGTTNDIRYTMAPRYAVAGAACGESSGLALKLDGTVLAWGSSSAGSQTNLPPGLASVVALSVGQSHDLALRAGGTVLAWGVNTSGQTNVPVTLSNAVAAACGANHSVALRENGTVIAWGANASGQTNVPAALSNAVAVAAGVSHSAALLANGTVRVWGDSTYTNVPAHWTNIVSIACSSNATLALRADGTVTSWPVVSIPADFTNVLQLVAYPNGTNFAAVRMDGTIGVNGVTIPTYGQTNGAVSVAPGKNFGFALVPISQGPPMAGTLPPAKIRPTAVVLAGMASANGLAASAWFEWGTNASLGQTTPPAAVRASSVVRWVTAEVNGLQEGGIYVCRLVVSNALGLARGPLQRFTTGNKLAAWGTGWVSSPYSGPIIAVPAGITNVVSADNGRNHTLALLNDGTIRCLSDTNYYNFSVPDGLTNTVAVAAGWSHCVALQENGTITAWGWNGGGQTNVPAGLSNVVAIGAGGWHSAALTRDGQVIVWGGAGLTGVKEMTTIPSSAYNLVSIATSGDRMVALRNDGQVVAWGDGATATKVPSSMTNCIGIAGAVWDSAAIKPDGTVQVWGANDYGQTNVPPGLSNVVSVSGGWFHLVALREDGSVVQWGSSDMGRTNMPPALVNVAAVGTGDLSTFAIGPNVPPLVYSDSVTGYVNAASVISLRAYEPNGDPISRRMCSLPAHGGCYQYNNGVPGAPILETNSVVTDPDGRIIFVPESGAGGSPLTAFRYLASDGEADSAPATITVHVVLPPQPSLVAAGSGITTNGAFLLSFTGASNVTYRVWVSTNLLNWEPLGLAQPISNGWFRFLDLNATNDPLRFYRAGAL